MMSVAEIGLLQGRYVRLSDRFKSIWTYHQFASGVFKSLLQSPLPYHIDFQNTYDRIRAANANLNALQIQEAASALGLCELALDRITTQLVRADDQVSASAVRRFFEKLKRQDEGIIQYLIKFYLYADAVEGDRRDKVDFLFTRIGEDFIAERGEYWSRDSLEFRERIISLVSLLRTTEAPQDEVVRLIRAIRGIRDDIQSADAFEELTERNLLKNARLFKHRLGDLYFQPDILMSIVELNVTTKNKFLRLYAEEEERIVDDAQKLIEHGPAIERNFGYTNPELVEEISRFREFKQRFDVSRSASNVKHDVITHLKQSMTNILTQLDRGLGGDDEPRLRSAVFVFQRGRARGEHHEPLRRSASASVPDADRGGHRRRRSFGDAGRGSRVSQHQRTAARVVGDRRVSETVRAPRGRSGRRQRRALDAVHARGGAADQSRRRSDACWRHRPAPASHRSRSCSRLPSKVSIAARSSTNSSTVSFTKPSTTRIRKSCISSIDRDFAFCAASAACG